MNYIVIEMQTTNGVTSALHNIYNNYPQAEQQYHTVLAAAAVSSVPLHAAAMLNERGQMIKFEFYDHSEPDPVEDI